MSDIEFPLQNLEKLAQLSHAVERVKRVARRPDEKEMTNTAEHTFELMMMCWYLASVHKLELKLEKVLLYALAHDVVEAYAGDTFAYDEAGRETKKAREAAALQRLEEEFPEFQELTALIHQYEARTDAEAKFVYAADKLLDPLNAGLETAQSIWKDNNINFEMLLQNKTEKIDSEPTIRPYWDQLVTKLIAKKDFFFFK